ncbi:four-carbon acid sugar kinase family protein [Metasolibacillus meyeri]|uniref:Four-carbon acid sugar kinase family protein n=1 Tax=Metasolibacillus meyeri TaxID=1071052 RepID=A0AAW9NHN0_9BACL|nr:four-carbon acid sugar kinase family protein [Metasolibacillus meyeri]MEC1178174.1 four-carbon acid sugar kinase family protein [Metasolibacillus meyeri]
MTTIEQYIASLPPYGEQLQALWTEAQSHFQTKIIVLDDDPTGVQTVHSVPVFTNWTEQTIHALFEEPRQLTFILTNSRSFSKQQTTEVHAEIAATIAKVAQERNERFLLISRSDSTLRGHYPLETDTLRTVLEQQLDIQYDGEIMMPFFKEGGRETIQDIHYVKQNGQYVPAAQTEFAKDRMFSFTQSDLKAYIEEKTAGAYKASDVISISLAHLRALDIDFIEQQLMQVQHFNKVIVNAHTEDDVKVFVIALIRVLQQGKQFLFRTAASFTKVIGNVSNRPLLTKEALITEASSHGGIIVVGSHVQKTTEQLAYLKELSAVHFIEFNCLLVTQTERFEEEIRRVQQEINATIATGQSVCVYTTREVLQLEGQHYEQELALSVKIANAVTSFVKNCHPKPKFVIAKGGITSSDVGTIGLAVQKAEVMGQVAPGIPVWKTDLGSTFPSIPYIIFPGNVGEKDTLKQIVQALI